MLSEAWASSMECRVFVVKLFSFLQSLPVCPESEPAVGSDVVMCRSLLCRYGCY